MSTLQCTVCCVFLHESLLIHVRLQLCDNSELGYKNEQDHIKECMEIELKKRKQVLFLEQQAALGVKQELGANNPAFDVPADDDAAAPSGDEEEDEELAMAKQLEQSEVKSEAGDVADEEMFDQDGDDGFEKDESEQIDDLSIEKESGESLPTAETTTPVSSPTKTVSSVVSPNASRESSHVISTSETQEQLLANEHNTADTIEPLQNEQDATPSDNEENAVESSHENQEEAETSDQPEETATKSNKPRNSAWQEMLRKEKEMLSKQKKIQRKGGGLVEGEAEEEEEEEGIVGLEDFGFSVEKVSRILSAILLL